MTQAPATPELVERLRTPWSRMGGVVSDKVDRMLAERQEAAAALEAQQARIAELEAELADVAIPSPYCEICGSCGSEGCGCEHKCKYAHSHPDVVRDMDALQALADRFEKALRFYANAVVASQHPDRLGACDDGWAARQALSSQGRREGGEAGFIPESPGVNAVPLPASPDGLLSAEERDRLRTMVWMAWREMNAVRAATGSPRGYDGYSLGCSEEWWSDMVEAMGRELGDADRKPWSAEYMRPHLDAMRTADPSPDNTNPDGDGT